MRTSLKVSRGRARSSRRRTAAPYGILIVAALTIAACDDRPTAPAESASALSVEPAQGGNTYRILGLGALPGGAGSWADDINDAGVIVGTAEILINGQIEQHAFKWANGVMTDLGVFPGDAYSSATAINEAGTVVGYSVNAQGVSRAVLWSGGSIYDLGTLGGSGGANAEDINESGVVVGSSWTAAGGMHAFRWMSKGGMVDLTPAARRGVYSSATAISDAGWVAGATMFWDGSWMHGMTWSPQNVGTDVGTLGGRQAMLLGINNSNEAVGWSTIVGPGSRAVRSPQAMGMIALTIPSPYSFPSAADVSDKQRYVGGLRYAGDQRAFTKLGTGGTVTILPVISYGDDSGAVAVNTCGTIVGYVLDAGGVQHAVRWQKPICDP
jgi:probable HAF family extracellular repeat protein